MQSSRPAPSSRRAIFALILLSLIAWLPGFFTLPPLDRDESRFAQATKQMLESGNFVDIRLGEQARYEKPVGIYWLQAVTTAALGGGVRNAIWTYRVPSLLGALVAVIATFFIARLVAGVEAGFVAGALLALSVLLMAEAKIAKTDAMLVGTVAVFQLVLLRAYLSARVPETPAPTRALALFGWAVFGFGILVKGPLIALICGLSVVAVSLWDRDAAWLKRLHAGKGIILALLMVVPWLVAIGIASHGQFFAQSLGQDFGGKAIGDAEAHGAPPGYFTVLAHATFWPASLALLPALVMGWKRRREPAVRYLLAWAASTFLMFELVPTKLPHYVLPAYPALAVLCGLWLTQAELPQTFSERMARFLSLALFLLIGLALTAAFAVAPTRFGERTPWWLYASAGIAGLAILATAFLSRQRLRAAAMAGLAALLLYQVAGSMTVPRLSTLWLSPRLADAVARYHETSDPPVVIAGYAEPSIAFLLGTRTKLVLGAEAGTNAARDGGLALVDDGETRAFLDSVAMSGGVAQPLEEITGINYSRGRTVRLTLYRVSPQS